jgi:hypothetical protein
MYSIQDALEKKIPGLFYGPRVILPFVCDILKAIIDDDIITDFSPVSKGAYYEKHDKFTEIYFFGHERILEDVSKYESIKMIVVDEEDDIFDFEKHTKICLKPFDNHKLEISKLDDDIIFIE